MLKFERILSVAVVAMMILGMHTIAFANEVTDTDAVKVASVNYFDDINEYEAFTFNAVTRTTDEPTSKWDWSQGAYSVDGSSNAATLYTNYYFTDVVGRKFSFSASSSNRITVDLVHKGIFIQSVVSTWTIDAGSSKTLKIEESDLDGKEIDGKYYFRFNSNPIGHKYSISGTFR